MSIVFVLQSCKEKEPVNEEKAIESEDAKLLAYATKRVDDIFDFLVGYGFDETVYNYAQDNLPSCTSYTQNATGPNSLHETWDFSNTGCLLSNNITYKGKLSTDRNSGQYMSDFTGNMSFDNFYVNDVLVEGSIDFDVKLGFVDSQSEFTFDLSLQTPSGKNILVTGTITRKFVDGADTGNRDDDIFRIDGDYDVTIDEKFYRVYLSENNLFRDITCGYFNYGIFNIRHRKHTSYLDVGADDGECDRKAVLYDDSHEKYAVIQLME